MTTGSHAFVLAEPNCTTLKARFLAIMVGMHGKKMELSVQLDILDD